MGSTITHWPSDPNYPDLEIPEGTKLNKKNLADLKDQLTRAGVKVEKIGPIKLPAYFVGKQHIHFLVRTKEHKSVPVVIFTKRTRDPIDLELFLGRLAIWGKFAGSPFIAYSVMRKR